jgi:hypothetical protein
MNLISLFNSTTTTSTDNSTLSKIHSYDAIQVETEQLLKREQTIFMINSVITFGLLITLFKVI